MHVLASVIFGLLVLVTATTIAAAVFAVWIVYLVIRTILWIIGGVVGAARRKIMAPSRFATLSARHHFPGGLFLRGAELRACPHLRCQQFNPRSARFCRRCGRALADESRGVSKGRAATA